MNLLEVFGQLGCLMVEVDDAGNRAQVEHSGRIPTLNDFERNKVSGSILGAIVGEFCLGQRHIPLFLFLTCKGPQKITQASVHHLGLAIRLRVINTTKSDMCAQISPQILPEMTHELRITI